jgi:plastocyanin
LVSGQATKAAGSDAFLGKLTLDVAPRLVFTFGPAAPVVGQQVVFAAASIGASSAPTVTWDFGSGSFTTTGLTATHTFTSPGAYTVRAQATDAYGATTIATQIVTVAPAPASVNECTSAPTPTVAITSKLLLGDGLLMAGSSAAHCPSAVKSVGIAIARVKGHKCSFLSAHHRWGKYGGCKPRPYLRASGTYSWAFALVLKFVKGTYWVWERAVDSAGVATPNTPGRHVTLRARGRRG